MKRPNINLSVLATILVLFSGNAIGQAGGKESQKFEDYRDDARETLTDTKVQLESTVALYNSLLNAEAEKPESTYKDLTSATKKSEKLWASYGKDEGKMQKQANKMFANWQEEINAYGNEQMKQLAAERLEVAKMDYDRMVERMKTTGEVYTPFMTSLNDQLVFMSRDLSPEAMVALQPVAQELNTMAGDLFTNIEAILTGEPAAVEMADEAAAGDDTVTADETAAVEETVIVDETTGEME